jgi:hypothetical protein
MILLSGLYSSGNAVRDAEMRLCLQKNGGNTAFGDIYVFCEGDFSWAEDIEYNKILKQYRNMFIGGFVKRMTYKTYLETANVRFKDGTIVCLANSDIYFDSTISLIKPEHLDNVFMCLSRWKHNPDGPPTPDLQAKGGSDAWIFKTPVRVPAKSDFTQGHIACDNRIAWLMQQEGYKLENPASSVHAIHVHASNFRSYGWETDLLYDKGVPGVPWTEVSAVSR